MITIKHTIPLLCINSLGNILNTLNALPNTECTLEIYSDSSVDISIELNFEANPQEIFILGVLVGSLEVGNLLK